MGNASNGETRNPLQPAPIHLELDHDCRRSHANCRPVPETRHCRNKKCHKTQKRDNPREQGDLQRKGLFVSMRSTLRLSTRSVLCL